MKAGLLAHGSNVALQPSRSSVKSLSGVVGKDLPLTVAGAATGSTVTPTWRRWSHRVPSSSSSHLHAGQHRHASKAPHVWPSVKVVSANEARTVSFAHQTWHIVDESGMATVRRSRLFRECCNCSTLRTKLNSAIRLARCTMTDRGCRLRSLVARRFSLPRSMRRKRC